MTTGEAEIKHVAAAFDRQSKVFDEYEEANKILLWTRLVIHRYMEKLVYPGQCLLDLNAGTGIDAVYFARHGVRVHAIDISSGMLDKLRRKIAHENLLDLISVQQLSFTKLDNLAGSGFDHIFSNFGGINCVSDVESVIKQFDRILKPGGMVTLIVMPPICPWEIMFMLKGNFELAFRRLRKGGASANVEGVRFTSHYFTPKMLIGSFSERYKLFSLRGLTSIFPPPYCDKFLSRYPRLFERMKKWDEVASTHWPFRSWADHFILTMQYQP